MVDGDTIQCERTGEKARVMVSDLKYNTKNGELEKR